MRETRVQDLPIKSFDVYEVWIRFRWIIWKYTLKPSNWAQRTLNKRNGKCDTRVRYILLCCCSCCCGFGIGCGFFIHFCWPTHVLANVIVRFTIIWPHRIRQTTNASNVCVTYSFTIQSHARAHTHTHKHANEWNRETTKVNIVSTARIVNTVSKMCSF